MKKTAIISTFLALLILLAGCANIDDDTNGAKNTSYENASLIDSFDFNGEEKKIHFYTGSKEYSDIDNTSELQNAIDELESLRKTPAATEKIIVTLTLAGDVSDTEEYRAIVAERGTWGNDKAKIDEWRQRLNACVMDYNKQLFDEAAKHIEFPEYCTVGFESVAPFVTVSASFDEFEPRLIAEFAKSGYVAVVSISFETHSTPDETVPNENSD